jgi:uncharacterized membrane protein
MREMLEWIYSQSALLCHQIDARTLMLGDELLPLCSRCTGIYSGAFWGTVLVGGRLGLRRSFRGDRRYIAFIVILIGFALLDWFMGIHEVYDHNLPRVVSGFAFGLAVLTVVWSMLSARLWAAGEHRHTELGRSFVAVAVALATVYTAIAAALFEWTVSYYLFLVSELLGVVILFTLANALMILLVFSNLQQRAHLLRHYLLAAVSGFFLFAIEWLIVRWIT